MRRWVDNGQDALSSLTFALLVLAVFGQIWFASTPLPFGGPNILLAIAATLAALAFWLSRTAPQVREALFRQGPGSRRKIAEMRHTLEAAFPARFRPAIPALLTALVMWAWVLGVYLRTGTFDTMRMGQFTVGIGVLFASLCVLSARRARWLIAAIVVATSLSALFGVGVLVVGKPFVDVWLHIANVTESDLETILLYGRTAGAAVHPATLGYQLAVAIVLGFAFLVLGASKSAGRWQRARDAAFFLLLTFMLTALTVNASRSTVLGVTVGLALCVVGVATGPLRRRGVVRLLVVGPSMLLVLLALFNPWFNIGNIVEELRPARLEEGDIHDLAVGGEALASGDPRVLGHRFDGFKPGGDYEVRLRANYTKGFGSRGIIKATADADGGIVVTWRADPERTVLAYQFRIRKGTDPEPMTKWKAFAPALRSQGVKLAVAELTIGGEALARGDPDIVGTALTGLAPGQAYDLQLRTVNEGPMSQAHGRADKDGRLVLSWRRAVLPGHNYQCRTRRSPDGPWSRWVNCVPNLPGPPVWPGLRDGSETLNLPGAGTERIGHEFVGFRPWKWYRVQVQETLADGVARAPRHGEVVFSPRRANYIVVTWPAPPVPEGVVGYRFRTCEVESEWLPWRAFTPSLNSESPTPAALAVGWSVVRDDALIRHLLLGLPPGAEESVQLRVRAAPGYSRESIPVAGMVGEDGRFVLAWRMPPGAQVEAVQFRRRSLVEERWQLWQDLATPMDGGRTTVDLDASGRAGYDAVTTAHATQRIGGALRVQPRLVGTGDLSARSRIPQTITAVRYAVDHPFGAGVYRPARVHAGEHLPDKMLEEILRLWPHNQFLHVLVLYGFPGLCLHLLFYGLLVRAAWRAGKLAWREPRAEVRFLVVAVIAAWAAYSVNSMLFPTGPFLQDWGHYFVLGLLLSLEGILAEERP